MGQLEDGLQQIVNFHSPMTVELLMSAHITTLAVQLQVVVTIKHIAKQLTEIYGIVIQDAQEFKIQCCRNCKSFYKTNSYLFEIKKLTKILFLLIFDTKTDMIRH